MFCEIIEILVMLFMFCVKDLDHWCAGILIVSVPDFKDDEIGAASDSMGKENDMVFRMDGTLV